MPGKRRRIPPRPEGATNHIAHHQGIWDALYAGGLIASTPTVKVAFTNGNYQLHATAKPGGGGGAKIRVLLCDPDTGEAKYYNIVGELDPDQTP